MNVQEREMLHRLLAAAVSVIDPEEHGDLVDAIDNVLLQCDAAGHCVKAQLEDTE